VVTSDAEILYLRTDGSLIHNEAIQVCLQYIADMSYPIIIQSDSTITHESLLVQE